MNKSSSIYFHDMNDLFIPFEVLKEKLRAILSAKGFHQEKAERCAHLFVKADLDGVRSHGINRFFLFMEFIQKGYVKPENEPVLESKIGMFERWNGQFGPGNLNAEFAMDRAIQLSAEFGIGCVALQFTNHWMRGGNFGWQAVEAGVIGICFTNTKPNMPAWGGSEPKLGNNPLVVGIPRKNGPVVLDMAMSQFAYGKMALHSEKGEEMPYEAGFDPEGNLTKSPEIVLKNELALPMGLWKGAGLSLVLDMLTSLLSGGNSTNQVDQNGNEFGLSQVFLCFDPKKLELTEWMEMKADSIISDLKSSSVFEGKSVRYPGESTMQIRTKNLKEGVPVSEKLWARILTELEK